MTDIKLKAEDPFLEEDFDDSIFNNSDFITNLYSLLTQNIEPPYSISLNGDWGTGKTTILKSLEKKLTQDDNFEVLWFNPWEYERSNDVVLVFLQQLSKLAKNNYTEVLSQLKILGKTILAGAVDTAARFITQGNLSFENIQKIHELVKSESLTEYETYSSFVDRIKEDFITLTDKISTKKEGNPLIVILDDLDRCLPENAIELIESLKNIFIIKGAKVIFVAGIDTNIAKRFIQSKYKELPEEFAYNYFKKVFNSTINIPFFNEKHINKIIDNEIDKKIIETFSDDDKEFISKIFLSVELKSIRSVKNIFTNFFLHRKLYPNTDLNNRQIVLLYLFKEKWQTVYDHFIMLCRKNTDKLITNIINTDTQFRNQYKSSYLSNNFITVHLNNNFTDVKCDEIIS